MADLKDMKTVAEWARSSGMNYNTAIKRRAVSGLGTRVPPGTWLLTRSEWERTLKTPLPGCENVR